MEVENTVKELYLCFEKLLNLAPKQVDFIEFARNALEVELTKGARKTHIKRMLNEFQTYAKNVLSKDGYRKFKYGERENISCNEPSALIAVISRGGIISEDEYVKVMDELNLLLQENNELSDEDVVKIGTVNQILAQYDLKMASAFKK